MGLIADNIAETTRTSRGLRHTYDGPTVIAVVGLIAMVGLMIAEAIAK